MVFSRSQQKAHHNRPEEERLKDCVGDPNECAHDMCQCTRCSTDQRQVWHGKLMQDERLRGNEDFIYGVPGCRCEE